jgi:hypothetical protein
MMPNYELIIRATETWQSHISVVVAAPDRASAEAWAEENASDIYSPCNPKDDWSDGWEYFFVDSAATELTNKEPNYVVGGEVVVTEDDPVIPDTNNDEVSLDEIDPGRKNEEQAPASESRSLPDRVKRGNHELRRKAGVIGDSVSSISDREKDHS